MHNMARDPEHRSRFEMLLYLAAKRGDADLVAADVKLVGEQCGACHKAFRAK